MRIERIHDTDVRFRRNGAGDAALVFVHGFLDDQYAWDGVIAELSGEDVETVQLDLAGLGSTDACGPFTFDRSPRKRGHRLLPGQAGGVRRPEHGGATVELAAAARPERTLGRCW